MSRHDAVLKTARGSSIALVQALADALREEIEAHDKTREQRNHQTKRTLSLAQNVSALEAKAVRLDRELKERPKSTDDYARGYADGLRATKDAVTELLASMVAP